MPSHIPTGFGVQLQLGEFIFRKAVWSALAAGFLCWLVGHWKGILWGRAADADPNGDAGEAAGHGASISALLTNFIIISFGV